MVVVRLKGGLGNQMFQYALGFAISKTYQIDLYVDYTFYRDTMIHGGNTLFEFELKNLGGEYSAFSVFSYIERSFLKINLFRKMKLNLQYEPKLLPYHKVSVPEGVKKFFLDGYWQSETYFSKFRNELLLEFILREKLELEDQELIYKFQDENSVSLHIRRGDYITNAKANKIHSVLNKDYYDRALGLVLSKIDNAKVYVFSDDPDWVESNFKLTVPFHVVRSKTKSESVDLHLMSQCKHNIIANSSYSWWAAWLNTYNEKIVVAPKNWFRDDSFDAIDLIPVTWSMV